MRETDPWKRIAKIFPTMSSDKAGDVTNAAGAITRILKDAGLDWHALAKRIEAPPAADPPPWEEGPPPNGQARGRAQERQERPSWTKPEDASPRRPFGASRRQPSAWAQDKADVEKLQAALRGGVHLDRWNMEEFIPSIVEWVIVEGRALTDRQREKINEAMDKAGL